MGELGSNLGELGSSLGDSVGVGGGGLKPGFYEWATLYFEEVLFGNIQRLNFLASKMKMMVKFNFCAFFHRIKITISLKFKFTKILECSKIPEI